MPQPPRVTTRDVDYIETRLSASEADLLEAISRVRAVGLATVADDLWTAAVALNKARREAMMRVSAAFVASEQDAQRLYRRGGR